MATPAKVTSTAALESFRASLIVCLHQLHQALDQVGDEVRRTRSWIQHEQRLLWEREVRTRARVLAQAEQELLSVRMVQLVENHSVQQLAVHKAHRSLEEAQQKLRRVKVWSRDFESTMEPLTGSLNTLREYLLQDMPQGIAYLLKAQKTLEDYAEITRPGAPPAAAAERPEQTEAHES